MIKKEGRGHDTALTARTTDVGFALFLCPVAPGGVGNGMHAVPDRPRHTNADQIRASVSYALGRVPQELS
ncbi:hypothetical protein BRADI_3g37683v3 [Brachypodium distachyon]|uniref:Uncharacterized protein n=1 Tax=Brachypodium distachyon TaxID=15368 RepID=A0A2K2D1T5_BRADI|nr:hypothetical protein BRADI_3g37683v3 [Brachypodium distachyon]